MLFTFTHLETLDISLYKSSNERKGSRMEFKPHSLNLEFGGLAEEEKLPFIWVNHCLNPSNILNLPVRLRSKEKENPRRLWSLPWLKITQSFFTLFNL